MSWLGWIVIGIMAANVLFFGGMFIGYLIERRDKDDPGK